MQIESKLSEVISQVYAAKSLIEARDVLIPFLEASKIKESDKKKMIEQTRKISQLGLLQYYATNALLKYEGLGL
jgi:hypothetical protein